MSRLSGKTAIVTGSESGIGKATAERFEREGARLLRLDRVLGVDVSEESQVKAFFADADSLDILVNSAGIAYRNPVAEQETAGWDELMQVNVGGTYLCSRYAIPKMQSRGGSIIHLSSVVGITGVRNRAAYSATKGAIIALTRNMALDYARFRIRVNCVCPGFTRTNLTKGLLSDPEKEAKLAALHPLGRLGEPEDVANLILFLASDEAAWITGQAIAVDGGFTAGHAVDV
jgi:NAD(P)-dependent dehydrogenase (short-subunit alcohol dehydrogenase family)